MIFYLLAQGFPLVRGGIACGCKLFGQPWIIAQGGQFQLAVQLYVRICGDGIFAP